VLPPAAKPDLVASYTFINAYDNDPESYTYGRALPSNRPSMCTAGRAGSADGAGEPRGRPCDGADAQQGAPVDPVTPSSTPRWASALAAAVWLTERSEIS